MIEDRYQGPNTGQDLDGDGIIDAITQYRQHQTMSPEEKQKQWIAENVWKRGMTVDMQTGEIVDPQSEQVIGRLPPFD